MDRRDALAELQQIEKGTITTGTGGLLDPSQARAFIDEVMVSSAFGSVIDYELVETEKGKTERMGNDSRLIRGHKENTDDGYRAGVHTSEAEYSTVDLWLPFEITKHFQKRNIEGESVKARVIKRMTRQFGLDLDDLNINGKAGDADPFVGLDDGLLEILAAGGSKARRVNFKEADMSKDIWFALVYAMPERFLNAGNLRWFCSPQTWVRWIESLTERETGAGDAALVAKELFPFGIPPVMGFSSDKAPAMPGLPFWPNDRIVLADPKNFKRVVSWDIERYEVKAGQDWGLTLRRKDGVVFFISQDFVVEEEAAVADGYGLKELELGDFEFDFDFEV